MRCRNGHRIRGTRSGTSRRPTLERMPLPDDTRRTDGTTHGSEATRPGEEASRRSDGRSRPCTIARHPVGAARRAALAPLAGRTGARTASGPHRRAHPERHPPGAQTRTSWSPHEALRQIARHRDGAPEGTARTPSPSTRERPSGAAGGRSAPGASTPPPRWPSSPSLPRRLDRRDADPQPRPTRARRRRAMT